MDGLSAAASAFGVVSLAVQLIQLTQNLRDFFSDVSSAPSEIRRLTLSLTQLDSILRDVKFVTEMQQALEGAPSAPLSLLASLKACEEKLFLLKRIVDSSEQRLRNSGRVSKHWESFKLAFKKKDIERFGEHLHQAIQFLTTAMTMNLMVLNLAGLEVTTTIPQTPQQPALTATALTETSPPHSVDPGEIISTTITRRMTNSRSVDHFQFPFNNSVLRIAYTRKTKIQQSRHCLDVQDSCQVKEYILCISSTMLGYYINLCFKNAYGSISHSLQLDPIADYDTPIFRLCTEGDIVGVQDKFNRGLASPFVRDPDGRTLLHYATWGVSANLITLLLGYGLDANKTDCISNQTPLHWISMGTTRRSDNKVEIIRALIIKGQNDPMDLDKNGESALDLYGGGGDGYLLLLNQEEFPIDITQTRDLSLQAIARSFADEFRVERDVHVKSWELALRRALQLGLSLTRKIPGPKTTIDYLFIYEHNQVDSSLLGQRWLYILASVGVDVDDYIREEERMHDSGLLHRDEDFGPNRRLISEQEGNSKRQSIRWEWFYHPDEPAYHVLTEFSAFGDISNFRYSGWQCSWPFLYIETLKGLVLIHEIWSEGEKSKIDAKMAILEARWARQAARRQRRSEYSPCFKKPSRSERRIRVPGAWVEDYSPISFKWPQIRILRFPWWLYLFTLCVTCLTSGRNFGFRREFLGDKIRLY